MQIEQQQDIKHQGLLLMQQNPEPSDTYIQWPNRNPSEPHVAYCQYFATGEGVTIFIAMGGSYSHAENMFKRHVPEYFYPGLVIQPVDSAIEGMEGLLPLPVLELLAKHPRGTTEYFSTTHYNLS